MSIPHWRSGAGRLQALFVLAKRMIPLHDDNPTTIRPWVTISLIVACVLVFLWEMGRSEQELAEIFYAFGFIPAVWFGEASLAPALASVSPETTILTSMFLHGGFLHLGGNMLYLWIFGNNVEDAMGHVRFAVFYLLCGVAAALTQAYQDPGSTVPMVGASGAIGGVLGAYFLLHPIARVLVAVPLGIIFWTIRIPAYFVLGLWFVFQLVLGGVASGEGGVAYWAHIGGFLAGACLILVFKRRGVPIWDTTPKPPAPKRGPWS